MQISTFSKEIKHRFLLLLLTISLPFGGLGQSEDRPNILLIIADDYSAEDSSLYNRNPVASLPDTPVIDALGGTGTVFNNAYAYPLCSPTRASLLTGRYGFRTGIGGLAKGQALSAQELTLPELFSIHAPEYSLASFGKWHLGDGMDDPNQLGGWAHYQGSLSGFIDNYYNWTKVSNGVSETSTTYHTSAVVDDFVDWVADKDGVQPWFAWVAFCAPHTPFHVPPKELHYKGELSSLSEDIDANPRIYFEAMVEAMDSEMGRMLSEIDLENVVIIFMGDNGTSNSAAQAYIPSGKSKQSLYEGGVRVPLLINAQNSKWVSRRNDPVHVVDLFATILDVAGIDGSNSITNTVDSRSLLPLLENDSLREFTYTELFNSGRADYGGKLIRDQRFKLMRLNDGSDKFYDLLWDPYERDNIFESELTDKQMDALEVLEAKFEEFQ